MPPCSKRDEINEKSVMLNQSATTNWSINSGPGNLNKSLYLVRNRIIVLSGFPSKLWRRAL